MKKGLVLGAFIASLAGGAVAVEIKGVVAPGYDSNPYRLSDDLDSGDTWFVDTNVFVKQRLGNVTLKGSVKNRAHEGSFRDADILTGKLKGQYKTKYILMGKGVTSKLGMESGFKDKTYVSRTTGQVGLSGGEKIEDRYDYAYWKLGASSAIKLTKKLKSALGVSYNNKSYDDLNVMGLSKLDYEQTGLLNTWSYRQSKKSKFKLALGISEREYDNKRQKSKSGVLIAGSDLKYYYHHVALSHKHALTPKLKAELGMKYEQRSDNGSGYYDTDKLIYSAAAFYKIRPTTTLFAKYSYEDYEYKNGVTTDENDADLPGRQGYGVKLGVEKDLNKLINFPAHGFMGVRIDNYDSNDPFYEYDRYQVFAGIKLSFER